MCMETKDIYSNYLLDIYSNYLLDIYSNKSTVHAIIA